MTFATGRRTSFAGYDHRRLPPTELPQKILGGAAVAIVMALCGSTVWYTADADESRIGVKIGAFADPTFPPPKISGFEAYRHPWALKTADLPMEHVD